MYGLYLKICKYREKRTNPSVAKFGITECVYMYCWKEGSEYV